MSDTTVKNSRVLKRTNEEADVSCEKSKKRNKKVKMNVKEERVILNGRENDQDKINVEKSLLRHAKFVLKIENYAKTVSPTGENTTGKNTEQDKKSVDGIPSFQIATTKVAARGYRQSSPVKQKAAIPTKRSKNSENGTVQLEQYDRDKKSVDGIPSFQIATTKVAARGYRQSSPVKQKTAIPTNRSKNSENGTVQLEQYDRDKKSVDGIPSFQIATTKVAARGYRQSSPVKQKVAIPTNRSKNSENGTVQLEQYDLIQPTYGCAQIPNLKEIAVKCCETGNFKPLLIKFSEDISPEVTAYKEVRELQQYDNGNLIRIMVEKDLCHLIILLVHNGFPVDYELDEKKTTFLMLACQFGHLDVVCFLLSRGANVHKIDIDTMNPLLYAVRYNHFNIVKKLVDYGADVNAKTNANFTALHFACMHNCSEIIQYLLEHGSDIRIKTFSNKTVFQYIKTLSDLELFRKHSNSLT